MAEKDCQKTIDLFLFEKDGKQHYSLIKHFDRLFRSQIISQTIAPVYICKKCFTNFTKKEFFDKHTQYCLRNETVPVKMPGKNKVIEFRNPSHKFPVPFFFHHFKHVSLLLMNLTRIHIKNMNLQDSVCISKDLMESEKHSNQLFTVNKRMMKIFQKYLSPSLSK